MNYSNSPHTHSGQERWMAGGGGGGLVGAFVHGKAQNHRTEYRPPSSRVSDGLGYYTTRRVGSGSGRASTKSGLCHQVHYLHTKWKQRLWYGTCSDATKLPPWSSLSCCWLARLNPPDSCHRRFPIHISSGLGCWSCPVSVSKMPFIHSTCNVQVMAVSFAKLHRQSAGRTWWIEARWSSRGLQVKCRKST